MRCVQGLGFAVFCLLAGSQWIAESAFPRTLPILMRESLHYTVISVVSLIVAIISRDRRRTMTGSLTGWFRVAVAGLLLLGLPTLLNELGRVVARQSGAALFTLVPLLVAVGVAAYGFHAGARSLMTPALIGLGGGLLLLPFQFPATIGGGLQFAIVLAAVLLTACGSVWLHTLLQTRETMPTVAVVSGANAVFLACAAALRDGGLPSAGTMYSELVRSIVLDLPAVVLLIWLVRNVSPERLAARFLIVPLVATIEGMILLHLSLDERMGLGMVLMAAASGALLFWSEANDEQDMGQLGLR